MNHKELGLLRKYLQGNTTPDEERYIRRWLAENEEDEAVKRLLREAWMQTSTDNKLDLDIEASWMEFKQKVKPAERRERPIKPLCQNGLPENLLQ